MRNLYSKLTLIIVLSLPTFTFGQTAILMGEVSDKNTGKPLANVTISIKTEGGQVLKSTINDERFGDYELDSLDNGRYTVEYVCPGYKTRRFELVEIYPKHILVKNVSMVEEFSRFSKKKDKPKIEQVYYESENVTQYLMYSGLTMIVVAAIALR